MPSNGHGPHQHINGSLPPLKNGLGSLADDMYLNRLHSKIGHEMDVDLPKVLSIAVLIIRLTHISFN